MVSLWLAVPVILVLGLLWYVTWNAAWTAGHIWRSEAVRALDLAEAWRLRAERAEKLLERSDKQVKESTRLVLEADERLRQERGKQWTNNQQPPNASERPLPQP